MPNLGYFISKPCLFLPNEVNQHDSNKGNPTVSTLYFRPICAIVVHTNQLNHYYDLSFQLHDTIYS